MCIRILYFLQLKIVDKNGQPTKRYYPGNTEEERKAFDDFDPVALSEYPLSTLFSDVQVTINNQPVNSCTYDHPYRTFFENATSYGMFSG